MVDDEISEQQLYDFILQLLRKHGADQLVGEIERVVGRGIVSVSDDVVSSKNTKLLRPMKSDEKLAVAIEFVATTLQVPLMVEETRTVFGCDEIVWHPDEPLISDEEGPVQAEKIQFDVVDLKTALTEFVALARELKIVHPEVV